MLRFFVGFVALLALPAVAAEFDSEKAVSQWYESNKQCRQGEDAAGAPVTVDQSDRECQRREVLTILLETHDFCWGASEQEWDACD